MNIKIKPIDKDYWSRVLKKQTVYVPMKEIEGIAYLLRIDEVTEPLKKVCFGQEVTLADAGYYWLQIGLKDENVWITAMYDENGNFVQYYFDVSRKNVIDGENSYFEDLFVDVIVQGENEIEVLDEDELEQALIENVISKDEYNFAKKVARQIIDYVLINRDKCDRLCFHYFEILRNKFTGD